MILAMLLGSIVSMLIGNQLTYEDCKKYNNEPKACSFHKTIEEMKK